MKSPLKDPYVFKSAKVLKEIFPEKSIIESYLLYGAEMELNLAAANRMMIAHTNKYPVYEFWWMIKNHPRPIAAMAEDIAAGAEEKMLRVFQETWHQSRDPIFRSALFYILNRCSDLSRVSCGVIDKSNITSWCFSRLKQFEVKNFHLVLDKFEEFEEAINMDIKSDFKFFPLGHYRHNFLEAGSRGAVDLSFVNHQKLWQTLRDGDYKWVLLYKRHPHLLTALKSHNLIMVDTYGNRTTHEDKCEDIIVTNF